MKGWSEFMRRFRALDQGAAAVEFALVAMVLLVMLMGVLEFGRAWAIQANLAQATREAAREMAIKDSEDEARAHFADLFRPFGESAAEAALATVSFSREIDPAAGMCQDIASAEYTTPTLTRFFVTEFTLTGQGAMRCGG